MLGLTQAGTSPQHPPSEAQAPSRRHVQHVGARGDQAASQSGASLRSIIGANSSCKFISVNTFDSDAMPAARTSVAATRPRPHAALRDMTFWASAESDGFQMSSQREAFSTLELAAALAVPSQPWRNMRADLDVEDSVSSNVVAA